ncbi:MAG: FecR family protein [Parvibaculum sp.]
MTDDRDTPKRPGNLRDEAAEWFAVMRGPEADARREEFEAWLARGALHRTAYNRIAETFSLGKALKEPGAPDSINARPQDTGPRKIGAFKVAGVALGLFAGAAALYFSILDPSGPDRGQPQVAGSTSTSSERHGDQLQSKLGEIREVRLKDGSRVTLDTDSLVLANYSEARRDVHLIRGRARFVVTHDQRPFIVAAGDGTITALGTVFDVAVERDDRVVVQLLNGAVDVRVQGDATWTERPMRLTPGQQLVFRTDKASAPLKVTSSPIADRQWPVGVREYDVVRLADLVAEANRYATGLVLVASADVRDTKVSGTFRVKDPKRLAENLADLLGLAVTTTRDQLLLSRTCPPSVMENCTPPS